MSINREIYIYIYNYSAMDFLSSSAGKESTCNAGDPGSGRSPGEGISYPPTPVFLGFPGGSAGKEPACNAGDLGSIPGLGRYPGAAKGYPLKYSGLENFPWTQQSMELQRVGHDRTTFSFQVVCKPLWRLKRQGF